MQKTFDCTTEIAKRHVVRYAMKVKTTTSRMSSANSSRQNTPRNMVQLSSTPFINKQLSNNHHHFQMNTPIAARPQKTPGSLQLPGLGVDSPFKSFQSPARSRNSLDNASEYENVHSNDTTQNELKIFTDQSSKDFVFKKPFPILKDTPRPPQSSAKSFTPTTPSPFNPNGSKPDSSSSAPLLIPATLNQPHWPAGRTTRMRPDQSEEQLVQDVVMSVADDSDYVGQENRKATPSANIKKRGRDDVQTPSNKKKSIKRSGKKEKQPIAPGSVRKSAVPVAMRRAVFEKSAPPQDEDDYQQSKTVQGKRKALDSGESVNSLLNVNNVLKPEDGFTWIGQESRGKKVKLDKDTIVKKRIEYFKKLGVEVPQSVDSPQFRKSSLVGDEAPKIKLRGEVSAQGTAGRIPLSQTPKKAEVCPSPLLRKVHDEDDLDEITIKRLEKSEILATKPRGILSTSSPGKGTDDGDQKSTKKSVTFQLSKSQDEQTTEAAIPKQPAIEIPTITVTSSTPNANTPVDGAKNGPVTLNLDKPVEKNSAEKPAFNFTIPKTAPDAPAAETKPSTIPAFSFGAAPTTDSAPKTGLTFGSATKTSESSNASSAAPLFSFGSSNKPTDEVKKPSETPSSSAAAPFTFGCSSKPDTAAPSAAIATEATKAPSFSFGSTSSAAKPVIAAPASASAAPAFSFGAQPGSEVAAGNPEEKKTVPSFSFGAQASSEVAAGKPEEKKTVPSFSFGTNDKAGNPPPTGFGTTSSGSEQKPTFTFGSAPNPSANSAPAAAPSFGSLASASSTTDKPAAPPTFGGFGQTTTSTNAIPAFGSQTHASATTPAPAFNLGTISTQPASNSTFSFGSAPQSNTGAAAAPAPAKPAFGGFGQSAATTAPSSTSQPPKFEFGQPNSASTTTKPAFGFGATTATTPAASTPFGGFGGGSNPPPFGSTSTTTQPPAFGSANTTSQPPAFGAASTTSQPPAFGAASTTSQPPAFGAATQPPAFGSNTTSQPPAFGGFGQNNSLTNPFGQTSTNTNPSQTFGQTSGGTSAPFGAAAPSTPFQFGATATPKPSNPPAFGQPQQSTPFQFGSSAPTQPPAFGAAQPQSFQFGGSTPAAPAAPGGFSFGNAAAVPVPNFNAPKDVPAGRAILQPKFRGRGPKGRR